MPIDSVSESSAGILVGLLHYQDPAMRNNLPVTQKEFLFPAEQMLVSSTDLSGTIQYCNSAFVAVSGFTVEEFLKYARVKQKTL